MTEAKDWLEIGARSWPQLVSLLPDSALPELVARQIEVPDEAVLQVLLPRLRTKDFDSWQSLMLARADSPAKRAEHAELALAKGQRPLALALYKDLSAEGLRYVERYAELLIEERRFEEVEEQAQRLASECATTRCEGFHSVRIRAALAQGKKQEAIIEYRALLAQKRDDSTTALALAALLTEVGQTRAAIDVLWACEQEQADPKVHATRLEYEAKLAQEQREALRHHYLVP